MANVEKKNILVVDNNPLLLKFMANLLEKKGHRVLTAGDGLSAFEALKTYNPDVVFLDLVMPNISGDKLCQIIRGMPALEEVYIVIVSAIAAEEYVDIAELGADACIAKGPLGKMSEHISKVLDKVDSETKGGLQGTILGIEDIHRREITMELLSSKRHFEVILEHMSEGIMELNHEAKIVYANQVAASITGIPEEKLLALNFIELFNGVHHARIQGLMDAIYDAEQEIGEDSPVMINGKQLSLNLIPINVEEHRPVMVILNDITERKKAEEEIRRNQLYQMDKISVVGQMAAGIAHEINNPVSFVLPNLELLQKQFNLLQKLINMHENGISEPEIDKFKQENGLHMVMAKIPKMLSDCLEGTRRLRVTTHELRQFTRMDDEEVEQVDLSELVDSSLAIAANEIKYRAKVIKRYLDMPSTSVNPGRMSQVFLNIILNAIQAIEEGQVDRHWIRVTTGHKDDQVFVEIANNGELIPPEVLPKVFEPFFTTKPRGQGTGLGLSISYSIVQQHEGHIEVESTAEEGTVFRIWLPIDTGLKTRSVAGIRSTEKLDRPARILVIDDEKAILNVMPAMLEPIHTTVTAQSGREALEILAKDQNFDVVLCDLLMPELTGMDVYERVKKLHPELARRFVFLTGGVFTPRITEFVKRVENPKLGKPFVLKELLQIIEDAISSTTT